MNNKASHNQDGFSLIEILGVLGIIVLFVTISIPYIKKYQPNLKLNATARSLTADLRLAQQLTITEQIAHIVEFDLMGDEYSVLKLSTATTTIKTVELDSEVMFSQINGLSNNQVRFNSYGAVSEAGDITLININNKTAYIEIKPSGYIKLE